MKRADLRQSYYEYSGKTSDILRQLGLAGIAIIWIFKTGTDGNPTFPNALLPPTSLIVLGLVFDLCQYIIGTIIWSVYNRKKEVDNVPEDVEFDAPDPINWATLIFFYLKIFCMVIAYICLLNFLSSRFVWK
jgi:hypothetical protein